MPASAAPSSLPRWAFWLSVTVLLAVHAALALSASRSKSTTNDEIAHLTGGYTFNTLADFRVQPENGVLPQRWHALPLAVSNPTFPDLTALPWTHALTYQLSYDFFYRSGNDADSLLFQGRAMNVCWGAGTLGLIAFATRRHFGPIPALFSTALAALSPTFLAHSALATSDMAMTFFFVATVLTFWRHLHHPTGLTFGISAVTFGLACVAKFSAVMLLPMMGLMILGQLVFARRFASPGSSPPPALRFVLLSGLGHAGVAVLIIWALFGFRFALMSPALPVGTLPLPWEHVLSAHRNWEPLIFALRDYHMLPEAFLYGFSYVLAFSAARGAFLDGELGVTGWIDFFPRTFLYKTPSLELISLLLATGIFIGWARRNPHRLGVVLYRFTPLLVLFGVYWLFSLTSHLNIGHRHILPTYPLLFVLMGAVIWGALRWSETHPSRRYLTLGLAGVLLAGQGFTTASMYPHYLAYFNPLVGGPTQGYRHLVDSSLDWGQDLPGLATWLAEHKTDRPVYLSYFGTGSPAYYGIDAVLLPQLPTFNLERPWHALNPGIYAISATMLQHVYRQQHQPWTVENESTYQNLRASESTFVQMAGNPELYPELLDGAAPAEWEHAWAVYEELRFARLCTYLKTRPPDAMIGYSILIFDLEEPELTAALGGNLSQLVDAMETAAGRPFAPEIY